MDSLGSEPEVFEKKLRRACRSKNSRHTQRFALALGDERPESRQLLPPKPPAAVPLLPVTIPRVFRAASRTASASMGLMLLMQNAARVRASVPHSARGPDS